MHSPFFAMVWEQWRLSRVEAAQRFAIGIVGGSGALVLLDADASAQTAFAILVGVHAFFWFSIAKLNGGRFMDGYKPGFPLYLLYSRPVPTSAIVGVAMAYDVISCVGLYLISAALLGLMFGQPLPVFSVALFLVTIHCVFICIQWSTRNRTVQWTGSLAASLPLLPIIKSNLTFPLRIDFTLAQNVLMLLLCVVSIALTLAGVARQRRGDSAEKAPTTEKTDGYPSWMISPIRFPCPTSSATKAQLWFELKSSGLPVLTMGLAAAALIFVLFAMGVSVEAVRQAAIGVPVLAVVFVLFALGGNAFGIRKRQGRAYVSAFESTQPFDTAELAAMKILVRATCLLFALGAIGASLWISSLFMRSWGTWVVEGNDPVLQNLLQARQHVGDAFGKLSGSTIAALAAMISISIALMVALLATFTALRTRYPRRVLVSISVLLSCGFALVLLAWAAKSGAVPGFLLDVALGTAGWIATAALLSVTAYLFWSVFKERLLTTRYVGGAFALSAAFGAAWLTLLRAAGEPLAASMMWLLLPPLIVSVLAPWSLGRVRRT